MVLDIIKYGHPVLREKGRRIERLSVELRQFADDLRETMYAADGVGLAAHQVGRPVMLTVVDVRASELPSELFVDRKLQNLADWMPLILVNPVITHAEDELTDSEGCLSFPEIRAPIRRAARITVDALNLDGQELHFVCTGLLARALQHELDHLNGVLFIDRMDAATRASFSGKLKKLHKETEATLPTARKTRRVAASI